MSVEGVKQYHGNRDREEGKKNKCGGAKIQESRPKSSTLRTIENRQENTYSTKQKFVHNVTPASSIYLDEGS